MTAVEDVAFVEVALQTALSDVAASPRTRPRYDRRRRRLCRRGCAGRPWGMSHRTDEAVGRLLCCRCNQRREACLRAVAGKLLPRSHVSHESLRFCRCSRRNCRQSRIKLHPMVELSSDLSVPKHSEHARNTLLTVGLPLKGAACCHSIFALRVSFFCTVRKALLRSATKQLYVLLCVFITDASIGLRTHPSRKQRNLSVFAVSLRSL